MPAPEPAALNLEPDAAAAPAEQALPAAVPAVDQPLATARQGPEILIGDDRPNSLRALTSSWNTDWQRHTIDYESILPINHSPMVVRPTASRTAIHQLAIIP